MISLLDSIKLYLQDIDSVKNQSCTQPKNVLTKRRVPVLWPVANTVESVCLLLRAMEAGIKPIIVPQKTPRKKILTIMTHYPFLDYYDGNRVIESVKPDAWNEENFFFALVTSGSTGRAKIIVTSEERITNGTQAIHEAQDLEKVKGTGIVLPVSYSYSFVNQLLWSLLNNRPFFFLGEPSDPNTLNELYDNTAIDMVCLVATQVKWLRFFHEKRNTPIQHIKIVNFAGAPFPMAEFGLLQTIFPNATFYNNYGCTEAMPRLTLAKVESSSNSVMNVGHPIGDIQITIDAEKDEMGPILFKGSSTALGEITPSGKIDYFDDWIPSGDIGQIQPDNDNLWVKGRHDQIVKINGERISLLEVEQLLTSPFANQVFVFEEPFQNDMHLVALFSGTKKPDYSTIRHFLQESLQRNFWPKKIYWSEDWPLLPNGKTDRLELKALYNTNKLVKIFG